MPVLISLMGKVSHLDNTQEQREKWDELFKIQGSEDHLDLIFLINTIKLDRVGPVDNRPSTD